MEEHPYRIDAALAAATDREVERRWREALEAGEQGLALVLARQLVLRLLPVVEQTCRLRGARIGLEQSECERLIDEASIKLLLRLLHDSSAPSLPALAAAITRASLDAPRREPVGARFPLRPRLRLVGAEDVPLSDSKQIGGGEDA